MGNEQEGGPHFPVEREQEFGDPVGSGAVEVPRGLVGKEDLGPVDEGSGEGDALLFSTRELRGIVVVAITEPDLVQQTARFAARVGTAGEFERQHDVLERVETGHQVERLEDKADGTVAQTSTTIFTDLAEFVPEQEARKIIAAREDGPVEAGV